MSTASDILQVAAGEVGYRESPAGSNRTKYGKWYGLDGQPWCMMFVQWVFHQAGVEKLLPVRTASCGVMMRAAKAAGAWVTKDYRPGDVVLYDFSGGGAVDHVGIVVRCDGSTIIAVEGNTSVGDDSNGGAVMERRRLLQTVAGAVRPSYDGEAREMDNTPAVYAAEAVQWARENGILFGDQSGDLKLRTPVTREQAITFLYRFAKHIEKV